MHALRWPAMIALVASACILQTCSPSRSSKAVAVKASKDRKPAPEFSLKDSDGRVVQLSDFKGKVVLVDFWATWCGPCKVEIPWFIELQRKHKHRGFEVVGIAMDDEGWEVVKPFVSEVGVNYRVVMGSDMTAQAYGGVDALPTTFLIDRNGMIAAVHVGLASKRVFEDGVEQLLGVSQAPAVSRTSVPVVAGAR